MSRLEPDFHGERRASAVTMPSLSDDRGPLSFYSRCRIYNSLIRNSAVAFGVNTLEKEETDNGSLIIGREESNMEIFDTRIVSELSLVGGSVR